ncbi:MAG: hypothetical protein IPO09_02215 [Anaeromyxobacter sp.]|nr:hypothetical protein [Anaeromyxobacter sp.]MBL0277536.1 hypothetical protein [Anaeromyxobacter sp.]
MTAGPLAELGATVPALWLSLDAQVTEDLRLGAISLGAGWFQHLAVDVSNAAVVNEGWRGRPSWVVHLEHASDVTFGTASFGLRLAGERLASESGSVVSGLVVGAYCSLAGDLFAPSRTPRAN